MNIIIIGAGIAGLSTALALQTQGIRTKIYEAAPRLEAVGSGIWLAPNAMKILNHLGLQSTVIEKGYPLNTIAIYHRNGSPLQYLPMAVLQNDLDAKTVAIHRAELQEILMNQLPKENLILDKSCIHLEPHDDKVTVHFTDKTSVEADIVIGADGIHSKVRQTLFPAIQPRPSGQTCWRGVLNYPLPDHLQFTGGEYWGYGQRFGFSGIDKERVYWFAVKNSNQDEVALNVPLNDMLMGLFHTFSFPIPELIRLTPNEAIQVHDLYDLPPLNTWGEGRVFLVGDAVHATTPNLGQGAAQAIESAWALAQIIAETTDPAQILSEYQAKRQAKAHWVTDLSYKMGKIANIEAPTLCALRNLIIRFTPEFITTSQLKKLYQI